MSTVRRVTVAAVVALLVAGVGGLGGFVVHWFVLSPTDDELHAEVAEITPEGLVTVGEPTITGEWVPSLERGVLHWELAPGGPEVAVISRHLEEVGWDVDGAQPRGSSTYLRATRGPMHLTVRFAPTGDDGSIVVSFTLGRRAPISSGTAVALGAGLGALLGGALGWFGPRRRARKDPRKERRSR